LKKLKKLLALLLLTILLCSCSSTPVVTNETTKKLEVITTLFPQYDFVRQIAGDKVNVTLLLPPGANAHIFEPTPADIIKMNNADLFIYTGEEMEAWTYKIVNGLNKRVSILDISEHLHIPMEEHEHEEGHVHTIDPHYFTNLNYSQMTVIEITEILSEKDPENKEFYINNANAYIEKLEALDNEFEKAVKNKTRDKIVFGGRFAFHYFTEKYNLDYISAYDGCSDGSEPSVKRISEIVNTVTKEDIKIIYHEELVDPKIAKSIAEQTGAKILLLHTCHNISKEDMTNGVTYLDLMETNLKNLKEGLN